MCKINEYTKYTKYIFEKGIWNEQGEQKENRMEWKCKRDIEVASSDLFVPQKNNGNMAILKQSSK